MNSPVPASISHSGNTSLRKFVVMLFLLGAVFLAAVAIAGFLDGPTKPGREVRWIVMVSFMALMATGCLFTFAYYTRRYNWSAEGITVTLFGFRKAMRWSEVESYEVSRGGQCVDLTDEKRWKIEVDLGPIKNDHELREALAHYLASHRAAKLQSVLERASYNFGPVKFSGDALQYENKAVRIPEVIRVEYRPQYVYGMREGTVYELYTRADSLLLPRNLKDPDVVNDLIRHFAPDAIWFDASKDDFVKQLDPVAAREGIAKRIAANNKAFLILGANLLLFLFIIGLFINKAYLDPGRSIDPQKIAGVWRAWSVAMVFLVFICALTWRRRKQLRKMLRDLESSNRY